jgi:hypothetical protein
VQDEHLVALQSDAPPGEYTIRVGLWNRYTGERMRVLNPDDGGLTDADSVVLPTLFIVRR